MNSILLLFTLVTFIFHPVTWKEFVAFLEKDHTNWVQFGSDGRACEWFAKTLEENAREQGIHVYRVRVDFEPNIPSHVFDAIDTSDYGIMYIEPQNDLRYDVPKVGGYLCYPAYGICWTAKGMKISNITVFDK